MADREGEVGGKSKATKKSSPSSSNPEVKPAGMTGLSPAFSEDENTG
jgi:hypothetical protein